MLDLFNTFAAGVLAMAASWAVMSPHVRINMLMHIGLVLIAIGFLGVVLIAIGPYAYPGATASANAFVHIGLVLCAMGYAQRSRRRGPRRRASDWADL